MGDEPELKGHLNLVVALPPEAKPLIRHFGLEFKSGDTFKVYANGGETIHLIISGVGKVSAAAAVSHLASFSRGNSATAWFNVGVAGHKTLSVSTLVAAHKITDAGSGRSWYPPMVLDLPCGTAAVRTVDKETHDYPDGCLVDMEATGFYATALRFTSHELIHCLKVVSDNSEQNDLDYGTVAKMISEHLDAVETVADQLLQLSIEKSDRQAPPSHLELFLQQWKFSVTRAHKLEKLLQRWTLLIPDSDPLDSAIPECQDGKEVLEFLTERLERIPVKAASL